MNFHPNNKNFKAGYYYRLNFLKVSMLKFITNPVVFSFFPVAWSSRFQMTLHSLVKLVLVASFAW